MSNSTRPNVFLGFAIYRDIYGETVTDLWNALVNITDYQFQLSINSSANIGFNRNKIVNDFLKSDCDYLVFIDQDMSYTPVQLKTLLDTISSKPDAGIVSGLYIKRDMSLTPLTCWLEEDYSVKSMTYTLKQLRDNRGQVIECDLLPTGFMAIRREVFDDVQKPYFHVKTFDDGSEWSSDSVFCDKVRNTGKWKNYLDLGIEVGHIGNYTYLPQDMFNVIDHNINLWDLKERKEEAIEKYGANSEEYWDLIWTLEKEHGLVRNKYEGLYNLIHSFIPGRDQVILDIGSGPGNLAYMLHCNGNKVTCADISPAALSDCEERGMSTLHLDVEKDKLKESQRHKYNYVVSTELYEHVNNIDNLMSIVRYALKPGGVFILTCPNNRLGPDEEPEHVRTVSDKQLFDVLKKNFEHVKVAMTGEFLIGVASDDGSALNFMDG